MKPIQILVLATAMATLVRAQNAAPTPQKSAESKDANGAVKKAGASNNASGQKAAVSNSTSTQTGAQSSKTANGAPKSGANSKNASAANVAKTGQGKATTPGVKSQNASKSPASSGAAQTATGKKASATSGKGGPAPQTGKERANKKKDAVVKSAQAKAARVVKRDKTATGSNTKESAPAQMAGAHGRRDPFLSPIHHVEQVGGGGITPPPCSSGKRCLTIPEIILQGTVKDTNGKMMALVATGSHTYMLRENDQVFNGSVSKITSDSVTFREFTTDKFGHEVAHEVIKRMTPAS